MTAGSASAGIDLYWLPLGGGPFRPGQRVRLRTHAGAPRASTSARPLPHGAGGEVPEGRFVIENAWPIPNTDAAARGVTVERPVWNLRLGRFRVFRYEVPALARVRRLKRENYCFLAQRDFRTVNPPSITSSDRETQVKPAQMCDEPRRGFAPAHRARPGDCGCHAASIRSLSRGVVRCHRLSRIDGVK